jgi:GNAT superfamily N-acetyltransferase
VVPRLLREANDRGWWDPLASSVSSAMVAHAPEANMPTVLRDVTADAWSGLSLAPRVVAPADPAAGHVLLLAALGDGAAVSAAIAGRNVVGVAVAGLPAPDGQRDLLALGVAPAYRRAGLAARLLEASTADRAEITLAERDPLEPFDGALRRQIAVRLLERVGFAIPSASGPTDSTDPTALVAIRRG